MKTTVLKRIAAVLITICLAAALTAASFAEIIPLEPDLTVHGRPLRSDGWNSDNKVYEDESIRADLIQESFKPKSSTGKITVRLAVVEISDPSQLRTTLSYESFEKTTPAKAVDMAKMVNAVVAINDDYCKFNKYRGYAMRQGVFFQDTLAKLKKPQDVLIIDDQGDFSVVTKATTESMEARIAEMAEDGRKPVNVFTFGPALIIDGEGQDCKREDSIHELHLSNARAVIGQLDHLKYFVMTVDGASSEGTGMTGNEMVAYIQEHFPECRYAYNLDGGNSSKFIWHGKAINKAKGGARKVSGLIYFASAATEGNP